MDEKRRLLGGAVSNAGNLRAWALRELKLPDDPATLEKLLAARQRPAEGLTLLPFWIAERAPTWPEGMPSVVAGITQATTALDLLQALQEATYHRLAQIAELVEKAAGRRLSFVVSGNPKITGVAPAAGECFGAAGLCIARAGGIAARRGLFCDGKHRY